MAAHELSVGTSDEYYTPRYVFDALGVRFDLGVAHPGADRWPTWAADEVLSANGLETPWRGSVWMNPPFGGRNMLSPWLSKFMAHGDGVALTPDRTSAPWWQAHAKQADLIMFVAEKIKFHRPDGSVAKQPGTGTTLWARGVNGVEALLNAERAGLGLTFTP